MRLKPKIVLSLLIISIVALGVIINKKLPNFKTIDPEYSFEEFQAGQINVVIGEKPISLENAILVNKGQVYFPIDFVKRYIDKNVFWDGEEGVLTVTNQKEMIRLKPNQNTYEVNYKKQKIKDEVILQNDIPYIPYAFLQEKYNITAVYNEETNLVILDDTTVDRLVGIITEKTAKLRKEPNIKSPILETAYYGDEVMTYSSEGDWTLVRTLSGNIGYINTKHLEHLREISKEEAKIYEPSPIKKEIKGQVIMAWDQIGKGYNLDLNAPKYKDMTGVNVLSPTWFEFEDSKGNLADKGTKSYVERAHKEGYQVWPLISHNFQNSSWTHEILSSTEKRDRVIQQLVQYAKKYNVDGINIDIENLQQKTEPYWVQFMNELYPIIREQGIYLSVDVYVPSPWTVHYNRAEIAKSIDYFIIMGYDEHWSGSEEAGSVSSLPWVQQAIESTLEEVPEEKVVLGVPFYTRRWREETDENGEFKLSSKALGMGAVRQELKDNQATPVWDEAAGQHYAEYERDGGLYRVWIEDEKSMAERAKLVSQYNLAGISAWKLGLESSDIWNVIYEGLGQN